MMRIFAFGLAVCAAVVFQPAAFAQAQADDEGRKTDRLLVKAQKICPVMGKDLTKMGGPVKAKIGEQTLFLCCKGCLDGQAKKPHWNQIQANLKKAQAKCPVMGKPLPKEARSTVAKGRRVFTCCPPCIEKIQADPEKYLAKVDKLLEENLKRETVQR